MKPNNKTSFGAALIVLAIGVTSPLSASADECKSLWIERNQIFKNQGYCFGSALGKGYFGNSGCTTKSPSLSSSQQNRVAAIKRREGQLNCAAKKKNWTVASLRSNSSSGTRSTSNSTSEPTGGGLLGSLLRGGIRAIEGAGSSSGSTSTSSLRYGCKFYCEGASGARRSGEIRVNTPHTNSASAQDYVRREYKNYCENNFGFHGGQSRGANVSYPYCETYYYE